MLKDQYAKEVPIKKKPLRNPGQSLEEEIDKLMNDRLMGWVVVIAYAVAFIAVEWFRWLVGDKIQPVLYTAIGSVVALFAGYMGYRPLGNLRNLKHGLLGERYIGHFLQNAMLRHGYWVVHDICFEDFNIDHALIGPGGVFAIETKVRSKRKGNPKIEYDGDRILVDGIAPDRDPVVQAKAAARSLKQILLEYTGIEVPVRSVVLFPGWYVETQPAGVETWVLNEKAIESFVRNERQKLSKEEVHKLAEGLGRYVRDQEEKRPPN